MQERPGADVEAVFGAAGVGGFFEPQFIEGLHRAVGLALHRAEGGEIVLADQPVGAGLHRRGVEPVRHPPGPAAIVHQRRAARHQPEQVAPFHRREPRVEIARHPGAGDHGHRRRLQMEIERLAEPERVPVLRQVAMRHLAERVHPGIGAPGGGDARRVRFQLRQRRLDRRLHRRLVFLPLPAGERPAVILDFQGVARHGRGIARAPGRGKPQRVSLRDRRGCGIM